MLRETRALPVSASDPADKIGIALEQKLVSGVVELLALCRTASKARTPHEQTLLDRQIDSADRQIDEMVYGLYRLTGNEIKIIEASLSA